MKKHFFTSVLWLIFFAMCFNSLAQLGDDVTYDTRISKQLENAGIKYSIIDKGVFKVVFNIGDGRTQAVFIKSKTYSYSGMEIREIFSIAAVARSKNDLKYSDLFELLELNNTYKLGAWQIDGGESPFIVQFALRISANATQAVLTELLMTSAMVADDMEKKLTNADEY